jgi:MFS family permease
LPPHVHRRQLPPVRYLILIAAAAALIAAWLFPRAFPVVVLENRVTVEEARQRADSFMQAHELPAGVRVAARFSRDESLLTFLDLAGGGRDTIAALIRGGDLAPYSWAVRTMTPKEVHETRVFMATDGRVIGFDRRFAEEDERPALSADEATALAGTVLREWLGEPDGRWEVRSSSFETRKTSNRVDRTITFERTDRRVATAPIRLDVTIAGDTPSAARRYVEIPEGFRRRYSDMRSANELFAISATVALVALIVAGALTLRHYGRRRMLRWRPAMYVGGVIGLLIAAAGLNELPTAWYGYDTATSPASFQLLIVMGSLAAGAAMALLAAATLAAAEVATRVAFPQHLDWWKHWRERGTRDVATRVAGGYALAAIALAYVVVFYLATRHLLGWWVPTELLDDPNLIATPMPWVAGIALALQAAVWEEALFRALPLSLLSLWIGAHPRRTLLMAAGVVASALVFGFAHSDYPSWPAYSRGVEIFLDAVLWAVVFLRFGLLVTVVAHFLYNATLFSIFAAGGSAMPYRVTAVVMGLALLAPALVVAWRWVRQRGFAPASGDATFAAWTPAAPQLEPVVELPPEPRGPMRAPRAAAVAVAVAVAAAVLIPARPVRGPEFTASRADVVAAADSAVRARGVQPEEWRVLAATRTDTLGAWRDYLRRHRADTLAATLAGSYAMPASWVVRYVRTDDSLGQREEEWRVRLRPDGIPVEVRHVVPDSAPGRSVSADEARAIARMAITAAGIDTAALRESDVEETARPARGDYRLTYTDTAIALPGGAVARVWVDVAGDEAVLVHRGVELPETFIRENRDRRTTRLLFAALNGILLIAVVSAGAVSMIRRRPLLVHERGASRRGMVLATVAVAVLLLASLLNDLPGMLFGYDTAQPWTSYVVTTILSAVVGGAFFLLLIAGLWLLANSLRRRVGIPAIADGAVLGGAGIGAVAAAAGIVRSAVANSFPAAPGTAMDKAVPILDGLLSLPVGALAVVPVVAIPLLVIAAATRSTALRYMMGVGLVALLAGAFSSAGGAAPTLSSLIASLAGLAAIAATIHLWGGSAVAAWLSAAVTAIGVLALHEVMSAANPVDLISEALAVIGAIGALALLRRASTSTDDRASTSTR